MAKKIGAVVYTECSAKIRKNVLPGMKEIEGENLRGDTIEENTNAV